MKLAIFCTKDTVKTISSIYGDPIIRATYYDCYLYVNDKTKDIGVCDKLCGECDICWKKDKYKYKTVVDGKIILRKEKLKRITNGQK